MIVYDDLEATEKIKLYDKGITVRRAEEDAHQFRIGYRAGDMWAPHLSVKEALQTEAEHFISCVCTGASPISDGATGLQVVEILEAASRSIAQQGNPIPLKHKSKSARDSVMGSDIAVGPIPALEDARES
jgi:predicted dehydrogenase